MDSLSGTDESTVPKLISQLKSSFRDEEFEQVEVILSSREGNLRREVARWKDKCRAIEKRNGDLALAKAQAEDETEEAQLELELCRKTYQDLDSRISRAVENVHMLLPNKKISDDGIGIVKEEPPQEGLNSVIMNCINARPSQRPLDSRAGTSDDVSGTSVAAGKAVSAPIVEIDDSDNEVERCVQNVVASHVVSCPDAKCVQSNGNGRSCNQVSLPASSFKRKRDDSSTSGSELPGADRLIASLDKVKPLIDVTSETSDVDMTNALIGNEELRMSAVCALYRLLYCNVKSANSCLLIKDRIEQSDALSIARLGKYLTDGHPQGKLSKSVQQLKDHGAYGQLCYALVIKYPKQLCEIYKKGSDPYFRCF